MEQYKTKYPDIFLKIHNETERDDFNEKSGMTRHDCKRNPVLMYGMPVNTEIPELDYFVSIRIDLKWDDVCSAPKCSTPKFDTKFMFGRNRQFS